MSEMMKPYPKYKDSAMQWLETIPSHWIEKRAKYFLCEVDERSTTGEEQLMSVSHKTGVTPRKSNVTMFQAESNIGHKVCRVDDLAINTLWAWMSALGVSKYTGLVSPAYGVYRQVDSDNFNSEYLDYLLRTPAYATEYRCKSTGITSSRLRLYPIDFLRIPLIQPPREEQELIVRFLKHQDALIRQFIRNRRRLIEVLTEQKQAIINRAVTRGLDPNVKMKPSGVDWLGDVPEHWAAVTLGQLVETFKTGPFGSILHNSDYVSGGIPLVNPVHMKGGTICSDEHCTVSEQTVNRLSEYTLDYGDIVFSRRGELGRCAIVEKENVGWLLGTGSIRARLRHSSVNMQYLITSLQGFWVSDYLSLMSVGATMPSLNTGILKRLPLPLAPPEEQAGILVFIEIETRTVARAITIAEKEIQLIRQFRARLVADVVTGKLEAGHFDTELIDELQVEDDMNEVSEPDEELAHADD